MIRLIATDLDGTLLEPDGTLPDGTYETVEELYSGQDVIVARMTKQLEEANTKAEFL